MTFELIDGEKLYIGNSTSSDIEGKRKVVLNSNLRKLPTLNNVLYVLDIRKNLISSSLLNRHGFCMVFELDELLYQNLVCMWKRDTNVMQFSSSM